MSEEGQALNVVVDAGPWRSRLGVAYPVFGGDVSGFCSVVSADDVSPALSNDSISFDGSGGALILARWA